MLKRIALVFLVVFAVIVGCKSQTETKEGAEKELPNSVYLPLAEKGLEETPVASTDTTLTSGSEIFILGDATYKEHPSAKGKISVQPFHGIFTVYDRQGRRFFYPTVTNISNLVLDWVLFVEWKDANGKTIAKEDQKGTRFMPGNTNNLGEMYFPENAVGLLFWVDASISKPIPSSVKVNYIVHSSSRGMIEFEHKLAINKKGTPFEEWQMDAISMQNISEFPIVDGKVVLEFNAGSSPLEKREILLANIFPKEKRDVYQEERSKISFPYEATEVNIWFEIIEKLPAKASFEYIEHPSTQGALIVSLEEPKLVVAEFVIEGFPYKKLRWVVNGKLKPVNQSYGFCAKTSGGIFLLHYSEYCGRLKDSSYATKSIFPPDANRLEYSIEVGTDGKLTFQKRYSLE